MFNSIRRNFLLFAQTKIRSVFPDPILSNVVQTNNKLVRQNYRKLSSKLAEIPRRAVARSAQRDSEGNAISPRRWNRIIDGMEKRRVEYRSDKGGCRIAVQLRVEVVYLDDLIKPGANSMDVSRATNELRSHLRVGLVGTSCTPFPPD